MASKKTGDLLGEIQAGALDSGSNLADVLRKCMALGGMTGSERLREWASRELKGYGSDDDVPPYRLTSSLLYLDGFTMRAHVTGQQVPYNLIPDVARDRLSEDIQIRQPVAELQDIVDSHRRRGDESVKLSPPLPQELVALINHNITQAERGQYPFPVPGPPLPASQVVESVYFKVGLGVFTGILDTVRTTLVELVAEIRAASPAGTSVPSRDATEQAVDIAVYGGKIRRIVVNQVGPHGSGSASAGGTATVGDAQPETKSRKWMWWVVGIAGVVAAVATVAALFIH